VITSLGQNSNYTIGVVVDNIVNLSDGSQLASWKVNITPPLPVGTTISFVLSVNEIKTYYSPGTGTINGTTVVKFNNNTLNPYLSGFTPLVESPREFCSPNTQSTTTTSAFYSTNQTQQGQRITMGHGDVVSGTSLSDLVITNGQVGANSCATKLEQSILISTVSPTITGGVCNSVTNNPQSQGINNHSISNTNTNICSDSLRNTLSASNLFSSVGRQGMAYSSSNNKAYVLDSDYQTVKSFVPNSTTLTTEFTWSGASYLLGYNLTNNKLYSWGGTVPVSMNIRNLNTNSSSSVSISGLTGQGPGKIEHNSVLNKIYAFSQSINFTTAQISVIDGLTNTFTNQITGITLSSVYGTVYNPNNNKLYFGQGGRIYTCSGDTIILEGTTLPAQAGLIALDVINNIIYLVQPTIVYKVDVATNTIISSTPVIGVGPYPSLRSMIYNPDNGKLYLSSYSTPTDGYLGSLNPITGVFKEIIGDGMSQPLYVPTNTIYGINNTALYEICGSESILP
jgi:hypothetical protein